MKRFLTMFLAFAMIFQCGFMSVFAETENPSGEESTSDYNMEEFLTDVNIKAKDTSGVFHDLEKKTKSAEEDIVYSKDAEVNVTLKYNPSHKGITFNVNDTISYKLPETICIKNAESGSVYDGPNKLGTYNIGTNGNILIKLTNESYLKKVDGKLVNGTISFNGNFNEKAITNDGTQSIKLGGFEFIVPFKKDIVQDKGVINIKKEIVSKKTDDKDNAYIEYRTTVSTPEDNTMVMKDVTVDESFTTGSDYLGKIYDVNTNSVGSFDENTKVWAVGDMNKGETHAMTFKIKINGKFFDNGNDADRSIVGKAEVYSKGEKKNEASANSSSNAKVNIVSNNEGYDEKTKTVTYTVKVSAPKSNEWSLSNVTVKDVFVNNGKYVVSYGDITTTKGEAKDTLDEKTVYWNIGSMKPGEEQTLTYTVGVGDGIFYEGNDGTVNRDIDNRATVFVNDADKGHNDSKVSFKKEWIAKNGEMQNDGRMKFTLHVNKNPLSNGKVIVHDKLSGNGWTYDNETGLSATWFDKDGKVGEKTLELTEKTEWTKEFSGEYYYKLVYYAKYNGPSIGTPKIKNGADVTVKDIVGNNLEDENSEYNHKTVWQGHGNKFDGLKKSFDKRDKEVASWHSDITANIAKGMTYEDWSANDSKKFEFTDNQLSAIIITYDEKTLEKDVDYTIERSDRENGGFKVKFIKGINDVTDEKPVRISYSTTLKTDDIKPGDTVKYKNRAEVVSEGQSETSESTCDYTKEHKLEKSVEPAYVDKDGSYIIPWTIKVNITGTLNGEARVTDALPEGLEYVSAEITSCGDAAKGKTTMDSATVKDNVVTMDLKGLQATEKKDAFAVITLKTKVVDEKFLLNNGEKKFTNTAKIEQGNESVESTADTTVRNNTLSKNGRYDAPNMVYKINVNPNGVDMLKDSNTIRVEDQMGEGLMLISDTLKITDKNNKEVTPENLKINGNTFSFDVPDNKALVVEYEAYLAGEVGDKVSATNKVTWSGMGSSIPEETRVDIEVKKSAASIEGVTSVYVKKLDASTREAVDNTKFTLWEVAENGDAVEETEKEFTTDEDGIVSFIDLDDSKVYAFAETKAKDGYFINAENKEPYYFAFKSSAVSEDLKDKVNVIQSGTTLERYNAQTEMDITKVDFETNVPLEMTELELWNSNDILIDKWTTGESAHLVTGKLVAGETYTLKEVNVPTGYTKFDDIKFTMNENGTVKVIEGKDVTLEDNHMTVADRLKEKAPEYKSLTVKKEWILNNGGKATDSVEVVLLKNGERCGDPVKLSDDNDWTYSWSNLDSDSKWTVQEINIPKGFESTVSIIDGDFVVTNDDIDSDTGDDDNGKIWEPRTGDISTGALIFGGVLIIAIGGVIYTARKNRRKH